MFLRNMFSQDRFINAGKAANSTRMRFQTGMGPQMSFKMLLHMSAVPTTALQVPRSAIMQDQGPAVFTGEITLRTFIRVTLFMYTHVIFQTNRTSANIGAIWALFVPFWHLIRITFCAWFSFD